MKKRFLTAILLLLTTLYSREVKGDEGMWLIGEIGHKLYQQMKEKGLKLTPGEIYSPNSIALTDAIVAIDGGSCSGSIVSEEGLMITNHHCAYRDIHRLSTPEKNYLEEGFWAMNRSQEIPIEGKSVTFLRGVVDVTELTKKIIDSLDRVGPRGLFFLNKVSAIVEEYYDEVPYEKRLTSEWKGSRYLLYFFESYNDVRLVGAPPSYIGAFGGEEDNWGWPQHKGDFTLYRVYGDVDGKPAPYSKENRPINSKRYLKVSSKGVEEGSFVMILGYPGSTNRYSSSFEVKEKFTISNPIIASVRRAKLDVWKEHMERDETIRLNYADKYFGVSNYADYAKWENLCIERFEVIEKIEEREREMREWIAATPERRARYGELFEKLERGYTLQQKGLRAKLYFQESLVRGADFLSLGQRYRGVGRNMERLGEGKHALDFGRAKEAYQLGIAAFESVDYEADKELFEVLLDFFIDEVPKSYWDPTFENLVERYGGDSKAIAHYIYSSSVVTDRERFEHFFSQPRSVEELLDDPIIEVVNTINMGAYNGAISALHKEHKLSLSALNGDYVRVLYQMRSERGDELYPDANSTMRLTFGTVGGSTPKDAVKYNYFSTAKGILEKEDPTNYEFKISTSLKEALQRGEWGRWGREGALPINFMSDNDITGGNSGSAVMDGEGRLVGLAFDGNRESMAGDLYFVEEYNKSVSVDIRYVLWVMEFYAGATHLLEEMEIE